MAETLESACCVGFVGAGFRDAVVGAGGRADLGALGAAASWKSGGGSASSVGAVRGTGSVGGPSPVVAGGAGRSGGVSKSFAG